MSVGAYLNRKRYTECWEGDMGYLQKHHLFLTTEHFKNIHFMCEGIILKYIQEKSKNVTKEICNVYLEAYLQIPEATLEMDKIYLSYHTLIRVSNPS